MSYKIEPAILSHDTGQQIPCFDRYGCPISKKYTVNLSYVSLSTYFLEYGRHVGQLRRRHHAYAPMSNTASHDNLE